MNTQEELFPKEVKELYLKRLINQIWKLIPMKENEEDWQTHLQGIIEEVSGLAKIYRNKVESLVLLSKLQGLTSSACDDFMLFRSTVFACIDSLSKVLRNE